LAAGTKSEEEDVSAPIHTPSAMRALNKPSGRKKTALEKKASSTTPRLSIAKHPDMYEWFHRRAA